MLNPRAIAVQGIGFSPRAVLNMGFMDLEVIITPIPPEQHAGGSGGYAERPPEEKVKLTFIVNIAGQRVVKNYIVTQHAGMQLLKHIQLTKKAAAKVSVQVGKVTNILHRAKAALAKVNINMIRKKP